MATNLTFENTGGKTRYTARATGRADYESHQKMGFEQGWNPCADQLAALPART